MAAKEEEVGVVLPHYSFLDLDPQFPDIAEYATLSMATSNGTHFSSLCSLSCSLSLFLTLLLSGTVSFTISVLRRDNYLYFLIGPPSDVPDLWAVDSAAHIYDSAHSLPHKRDVFFNR
jgi:hypothetical protein